MLLYGWIVIYYHLNYELTLRIWQISRLDCQLIPIGDQMHPADSIRRWKLVGRPNNQRKRLQLVGSLQVAAKWKLRPLEFESWADFVYAGCCCVSLCCFDAAPSRIRRILVPSEALSRIGPPTTLTSLLFMWIIFCLGWIYSSSPPMWICRATALIYGARSIKRTSSFVHWKMYDKSHYYDRETERKELPLDLDLSQREEQVDSLTTARPWAAALFQQSLFWRPNGVAIVNLSMLSEGQRRKERLIVSHNWLFGKAKENCCCCHCIAHLRIQRNVYKNLPIRSRPNG